VFGGVASVVSCTFEVCEEEDGPWRGLLRRWTEFSANDVEHVSVVVFVGAGQSLAQMTSSM
jgi:hypothetical protein